MLGSVLLISSVLLHVRAGNTECRTASLDWYTQSVGETPCKTYERLRQTCNAQYEVGNFATRPPGDQCDDQVSACCCNSIAFALSMLCQNCQYGVGSSLNNDHGFDAPIGTYEKFLSGCPAPTNRSLPSITQTAACNQGLSIPSYVYSPFWHNGDWYYEYTKQTAQLRILGAQNETHLCDDQGTPETTSSNSNSDSRLNVGAIVGGLIGGLGLLFVIGLTIWFIRRRLSSEKEKHVEAKQPEMTFKPYIHHPTISQYAPVTSYGAPSSLSSYTYASSSSAVMEPAPPFVPPPPAPPLTKISTTASGPPIREEELPSLSPVSSINSDDSLHIPRTDIPKLPPKYQKPR